MVPGLGLFVVVFSVLAFKSVTKAKAKAQRIVLSLSLILDVAAVPIASHAGGLYSDSSCNTVPSIT